MRLFVAVPFSEGTRRALLGLQRELREEVVRGRFSASENLHLTLAFLGECDSIQLEAAKAVMDAVAFAPFVIQMNRLGRFRRAGGDTWWAGVLECPPLLALQGNLAVKLCEAGFSLERRAFRPHVTLARQVEGEAREREIVPFEERVGEIALIKSERPSGGRLTYTVIYEKKAD